MEEKKNTQHDSKQKLKHTPKPGTKPYPVKSKMPRVPKPEIPHTGEDFPLEDNDYSYYRDDNRGD